jgi:hypothetical protein
VAEEEWDLDHSDSLIDIRISEVGHHKAVYGPSLLNRATLKSEY